MLAEHDQLFNQQVPLKCLQMFPFYSFVLKLQHVRHFWSLCYNDFCWQKKSNFYQEKVQLFRAKIRQNLKKRVGKEKNNNNNKVEKKKLKKFEKRRLKKS